MKKKVLYPAFILTFVTALAVYGGNKVFADDINGYPPIVEAVAKKFGVDQSEVVEVFDQERSRVQQEKQDRYSDRLAEAVSDGIITEEQKQDLLQTEEDFMAEQEALRLQHREEMQDWLEEQGINQDELMSYISIGNKSPRMHAGMHSEAE